MKRKQKQLTLPETEDVKINSCLADVVNDRKYLNEVLNDFLSDKYGCRLSSFNFEVDGDHGVIHITGIKWNTTVA